jgi:hypothetical protein
MSGRSKNSGAYLRDMDLVTEAKDFVRIELGLALTFIRLAHTRHSMGDTAGANLSRDNAKKAYQTALKYFRKFKLSHAASPDHLKLTDLFSEVKKELVALSTSATH